MLYIKLLCICKDSKKACGVENYRDTLIFGKTKSMHSKGEATLRIPRCQGQTRSEQFGALNHSVSGAELKPPYYAVIFLSELNPGQLGYEDMA